jgi:hypothetical protein
MMMEFAYVNLNAIRAKLVKTPETSAHSSIKKRTEALKNRQRQPKTLIHVVGGHRQNINKCGKCGVKY